MIRHLSKYVCMYVATYVVDIYEIASIICKHTYCTCKEISMDIISLNPLIAITCVYVIPIIIMYLATYKCAYLLLCMY